MEQATKMGPRLWGPIKESRIVPYSHDRIVAGEPDGVPVGSVPVGAMLAGVPVAPGVGGRGGANSAAPTLRSPCRAGYHQPAWAHHRHQLQHSLRHP